MDEDLALLDRYDEGDEEAFTELVTRHQKSLYGAAYRMVGHSADAMDLVQQAFVKLLTQRSGFRQEASLKTWLYQILINLCRNHLRDSTRHQPVEVEIEEMGLVDSKTALDPLVEKAVRSEVRQAIRRLPERQQETLILRVYEELPFGEISRILGCHVGTVKANYHHAVRKLREFLKEKPE
ncbi:MAG: RNA polymerase sigma factor [Nitrospirae bacterium]|nr:RNA polymerase sigma factor [Nitrospirota bacterium]MBI3605587.1 RNA polymerase sigma factor [Nitrospirota bacterium]